MGRTDPGRRDIVWDSKLVRSARQAFVLYGGPPLAGNAAYEWTVQLIDASGHPGPISAQAPFVTGPRQR